MPIEMAVSFFHSRRYVGRELPAKSTKRREGGGGRGTRGGGDVGGGGRG